MIFSFIFVCIVRARDVCSGQRIRQKRLLAELIKNTNVYFSIFRFILKLEIGDRTCSVFFALSLSHPPIIFLKSLNRSIRLCSIVLSFFPFRFSRSSLLFLAKFNEMFLDEIIGIVCSFVISQLRSPVYPSYGSWFLMVVI